MEPPAKHDDVRREKLRPYARKLRREQTMVEGWLWSRLRRNQMLGCKFLRQHRIDGYIVDFYCHKLGLVIELDGGQHGEPERRAYDEERTKHLNARGIEVIRFWDTEVMSNFDGVLQTIWKKLEEKLATGRSRYRADGG